MVSDNKNQSYILQWHLSAYVLLVLLLALQIVLFLIAWKGYIDPNFKYGLLGLVAGFCMLPISFCLLYKIVLCNPPVVISNKGLELSGVSGKVHISHSEIEKYELRKGNVTGRGRTSPQIWFSVTAEKKQEILKSLPWFASPFYFGAAQDNGRWLNLPSVVKQSYVEIINILEKIGVKVIR